MLNPTDMVTGKIRPEIIQKGIYYYARAVMVEDESDAILAAWEHKNVFRSKRNAWRIAKKIARRMSAKLNKKAQLDE